MSKLGELLKELFPIRGMGEQILGAGRTDQVVKFGQAIGQQIKGISAATISHAGSFASFLHKDQQGFTAGATFQPVNRVAGYYQRMGVQPANQQPGQPNQPTNPQPGQQPSGNRIQSVSEYFRNLGNVTKTLIQYFQQLISQKPATGSVQPRNSSSLSGNRQSGVVDVRIVNPLPVPVAGGGGNAGSNGPEPEGKGILGTIFSALTAPVKGVVNLFNSLANFSRKIAEIRYGIGGALPDLFKTLTYGLSEANRDLGKWNGSIAASTQRLDLTRMGLDIKTGRATSGGASELNKQLGLLLQEFQPIREDFSKGLNVIGVAVAKAAITGLQIAKTIAEGIPFLKGAHKALEEMEAEMKKGKQDIAVGNAALHGLTTMGSGVPKPPRPGPQPPRQMFIGPQGKGRRK